jgi:Secretion system C-terminal sorting domain
MTKLYCFLLTLFLLPCIIIQAQQCDYSDLSNVNIGEVKIDSAVCPSAGRITINTVTGGGGYYVYEIIAGPVIRIVQSQPIFNALPTGSYMIRVSGCTGKYKDTLVKVPTPYRPMNSFLWGNAVRRISGHRCGIIDDGVYEISKKPISPNPISLLFYGGKAPYRFQINTNTNFTGIPFAPTTDSAAFSNLLASTLYYIRITDACNEVIITSFITKAVQAAPIQAIPELSIVGSYPYKCSGLGRVTIAVKNQTTGLDYNPYDTYTNFAYWGNKVRPYLRVQIANANTNEVYVDNNMSLDSITFPPLNIGPYFILRKERLFDGETGLIASNQVRNFYANQLSPPYIITPFSYDSLPVATPLKTTIFFPGGDQCGTIVPAYSKAYNFTIVGDDNPPPIVTATSSVGDCFSGFGRNINVTTSTSFKGYIQLVELIPDYKIVQRIPNTGMTTFIAGYSFPIVYNNLIIGNPYRVVWEDNCGRKDSTTIIYNPNPSGDPPPTAIGDSIAVQAKCNSTNPNDSLYYLIIRPLPSGYVLNSIEINGVNYTFPDITNFLWPGTSNTMGYRMTIPLPPGSHTYTAFWSVVCLFGSTTNSITINPINELSYRAALIPTIINNNGSCSSNGFTAIQLNAYVKNMNTNYTFDNVKLVSAPNSNVFPLHNYLNYDSLITTTNKKLLYTRSYNYPAQANGIVDSIYLPTKVGLILLSGQQGEYTFSMDVLCADGTLVETITKTITVNTIISYAPSQPSLQQATALTCDGSADLKINMLPIGGTRPFVYEYKLTSSSSFILSGNNGADSVVTISPVPPLGTIYDIRVTDACGNTATSKVTVASFTGQFFITAYIPDCTNPFFTRLRTFSINGAYYIWKRNGVIFAQGFNLYEVSLSGISQDEITVEIDIYGCYYRTTIRTLVYTNDCDIHLLPIKLISFNGYTINATTNNIIWQTEQEQYMSHYDVERSNDGIHFTKKGFITAQNKTSTNNYNFTDPNFTENKVYYRLKMVDRLGKIDYSHIISIKQKANEITYLELIPNPVQDKMTLFFDAPITQQYTVTIYNNLGSVLSTRKYDFIKKGSSITIDMSTYSSGKYMIQITDNKKITVQGTIIKL